MKKAPTCRTGGGEGKSVQVRDLLQSIEGALEEVVAPAPIGVAGPIGVVVVAGLQEALRVGRGRREGLVADRRYLLLDCH